MMKVVFFVGLVMMAGVYGVSVEAGLVERLDADYAKDAAEEKLIDSQITNLNSELHNPEDDVALSVKAESSRPGSMMDEVQRHSRRTFPLRKVKKVRVVRKSRKLRRRSCFRSYKKSRAICRRVAKKICKRRCSNKKCAKRCFKRVKRRCFRRAGKRALRCLKRRYRRWGGRRTRRSRRGGRRGGRRRGGWMKKWLRQAGAYAFLNGAHPLSLIHPLNFVHPGLYHPLATTLSSPSTNLFPFANNYNPYSTPATAPKTEAQKGPAPGPVSPRAEEIANRVIIEKEAKKEGVSSTPAQASPWNPLASWNPYGFNPLVHPAVASLAGYGFNPLVHPAFNPAFGLHPAFNPAFNPAFGLHPALNPAFGLHPAFNPAFNPAFGLHPAFNPLFGHPALNPFHPANLLSPYNAFAYNPYGLPVADSGKAPIKLDKP